MKRLILVCLGLGLILFEGGNAMACDAKKARDFFNNLSKETLDLIDEFYDEQVQFRDPVVEFTGREMIRKYYHHLYYSVKMIQFEFEPDVVQGDTCVLIWKMAFEHPSVGGGKRLVVDGTSVLRESPESGKIVYHRDYFDMGAFIYQNVWGLGWIIRYIKRRMSKID